MTFQWLVGASSVCLSIGCALILWGLKVSVEPVHLSANIRGR
jgi:hypothetical protein